MSRATLHIGLPKTGTTAIQTLLSDNREILSHYGFHYPDFFRAPNHLELAAYATNDSAWARKVLGIATDTELHEFKEAFAATLGWETRSGDWIFSSEHLSSRLKSEGEVTRIAALLGHFESVTVLAYVRRQDEMAASSHSTWLRDGHTRAFNVDTHLRLDDRYDFQSILQRWDHVFGRPHVRVRLYPTHPNQLLQDFASVMGIGNALESLKTAYLNTAIDSKAAAFLLEMNRRLPRWENGPTKRFVDFSDIIGRIRRGSRLRLDPHDAARLLDRFRGTNDWVMSRAENADRYPGYFENVSSEDGTMHEELDLDDALVFARLLWAKASSLEKQLRRSKGVK